MQMKFAVSCLVALVLCTVSAQDVEGNDGRIVGGQVISISQATYNVQLRRVGGSTFCGGTLISDRHVLTAGHCFPGITLNNLVIVGGANLLSDAGVQRRPERIFIHPEYNAKTMHSDAAVIKLSQPMVGPNIKPVRLCSKPPKAGAPIGVTGWGSTSDAGQMSHQLRYVRFPITPFQTCVNEYRLLVEKNMFCGSGYEAKGHCFGDSGGPGLVDGEVCGINSFGNRCGDVGYTSAFTDVFAVRGFIQKAMSY